MSRATLPPGLGAVLAVLTIVGTCLFAAALAADEAGANDDRRTAPATAATAKTPTDPNQLAAPRADQALLARVGAK